MEVDNLFYFKSYKRSEEEGGGDLSCSFQLRVRACAPKCSACCLLPSCIQIRERVV